MRKRKVKKIIFETRLTENNKRLRDYILSRISKYKNPKECEILEIGIGNGRFGFIMGNKFKRYYGIEPDKEYLEIATNTKPKKSFEYRLGSAEKIPFNKKFDVVFYAFSWNFVKDHEKAIKETNRVLKEKGIVLIADPKKDSKGWVDKRVIKGSRQFNKELYSNIVKRLEKGIKEIEKQKILKIARFESDRINLWILKKGK